MVIVGDQGDWVGCGSLSVHIHWGGGGAGCQVDLQALKKWTQKDLMAREAHPVLREALVSIPLSLSLLKYLFLFLILYTYLCVCGNVYTGV